MGCMMTSTLNTNQNTRVNSGMTMQFRGTEKCSRTKNVHPDKDGRIHRRVVERHAGRKHTRVHVWSERHGARHGRMLLRNCFQEQSCVERLRESNEKGLSIPC